METLVIALVGYLGAFLFLSYLFHNKWFLTTELGKWVVIVRVWCDVNGVAFPGDSTTPPAGEPEDSACRKEANEGLAKFAYGRDLPHLSKKDNRTWIASPCRCLGDVDAEKKELGACSYYTFLRKVYELDNVSLSFEKHEANHKACKEMLWKFAEQDHPGFELYNQMLPPYIAALRVTDDLSVRFKEFYFPLRDATSFAVSFTFHSFGKDLWKLHVILNSHRIPHDYFVVSHDQETDLPLYTRVSPVLSNPDVKQEDLYYASTFTEEQFYAYTLNLKEGTTCLVQESHSRWDGNQRDPNKGKQATMFPQLFRIVRGIVLDDNICWKHDGPNFVRVNPFLACTQTRYFDRVFQPSSIFNTCAFWNYTFLVGSVFSLCLYGLLYYFFFTAGFLMTGYFFLRNAWNSDRIID